ncbi:MAG: hypothetical protein FWC16_11645 [Defluviitaleaceae bacterium]|nr:hypothetical protein [Defluviitaleaceae bacterium]MCL2275572.1 hypothetical protein [Defluviitaleaceae bacterium]
MDDKAVCMIKAFKMVGICLGIATIFFGAFIIQSYLPRRIQQTLSGIEFLITETGEYEKIQAVDIYINGRVHYGLFARFPKFKGLFEINEYAFTLNNPIEIHFRDNFTDGWLSHVSVGVHNGSSFPIVDSLGVLQTCRDFSSVRIDVVEWEPLDSGYTGGYTGIFGRRVIIAP